MIPPENGKRPTATAESAKSREMMFSSIRKELQRRYQVHFREFLMQVAEVGSGEANITKATAEVVKPDSANAVVEVVPTFTMVLFYLIDGKPRELSLSVEGYPHHDAFLLSQKSFHLRDEIIEFQTRAEEFDMLKSRFSAAWRDGYFKI